MSFQTLSWALRGSEQLLVRGDGEALRRLLLSSVPLPETRQEHHFLDTRHRHEVSSPETPQKRHLNFSLINKYIYIVLYII